MRSRVWSLSAAILMLVPVMVPASVLAQASASLAPPVAPSIGAPSSAGVATLPPDGTWMTTVSADELLTAGAPDTRFAGTETWTLEAGVGTWRDDFPDGGFSECRATYAVVGDVVRFTYTSGTDCTGEVDDIRWTLDDAGLHITLVATQYGEPGESAALWGTHPWTMVQMSPAPSASASGGY